MSDKMARREALAPSVLQPDQSTNLSLWLDRYAPEHKQEKIREHHESTLERIRVPEGYFRAFQRREQSLRDLGGDDASGETRLYDLKLEGRAIVGIGAASVRETNLSLLRPWGLPFIPGSALKGLASHVANEAGGEWNRPAKPGEKAGAFQRAIFGDVSWAGAVVFHDAWWRPIGDRAPIHTDTMTVHHAAYYEGKAAPADWDEPNPVGFLSVSGHYFAALTGPAEALDIAEEILRRGLQERGIGAKTAAGYGRASLGLPISSEVMRKLERYQPGKAAANTVAQHARAFVEIASQSRSTAEKRRAAEVARALVEKDPDVWKKWLAKAPRSAEEQAWFGAALQALPTARGSRKA